MTTLPQTAIQKMLGCRYPIIQTAMGWVATPELVAGEPATRAPSASSRPAS